MITIELRDAEGALVASAAHPSEAMLCVNRAYLPGDVLILRGAPFLAVQMDQAIPEGTVCLPEGKMTWPVPAGEHRLAYAPGCFEASRHIVLARLPGPFPAERDLARNPADLRGDTDFYPHCTANVETRNEACFCARNVIDGLRLNTFHGEWPFESWGIGAREDAWCMLDFGREVKVSRMSLTLRADFPHDAYWVFGHAVLSDGSETAFPLEKTGDRQFIDLGGTHTVRWIRLERLIKSDDPSAFPALRQWEVFGTEA